MPAVADTATVDRPAERSDENEERPGGKRSPFSLRSRRAWESSRLLSEGELVGE